jgi:hypothetical protein
MKSEESAYTLANLANLAKQREPIPALVETRPARPAPEPLSEPGTALPAFVHIACSACMHLKDGHCTKRGFFPIHSHLVIRLCGDYRERGDK